MHKVLSVLGPFVAVVAIVSGVHLASRTPATWHPAPDPKPSTVAVDIGVSGARRDGRQQYAVVIWTAGWAVHQLGRVPLPLLRGDGTLTQDLQVQVKPGTEIWLHAAMTDPHDVNLLCRIVIDGRRAQIVETNGNPRDVTCTAVVK